MVVVLAVANLPALFDGGLVDPALSRAQDPPAAWQQAAAALSSTSSEYRVMQLPGSEFGAFRWGYTVDPPLPGMTTKPLITRDLLPLGSPGVMDLLYALDDRVQAGTLEAASVAPVARFLGVDTVWVANDLAFERFRTPRPSSFAAELSEAAGLTAPVSYGTPSVNVPLIAMVDEHALAEADVALPPVQLQKVTSPSSIVRASDRVVVLVGSGDGIVDASAAGLLHGDEALMYAADATHLPAGTGSTPALTILTDSNRARAHHWRSSKDVSGFTETGTAITDVLRPDEADQRLPVFGAIPDPADETIATLDGGLIVRASGYGEPFAYRPEQRPAMAVDGDPTTAWVVADRHDPVGHYVEVSATGGSLTLLQPQGTNANRRITSVRVTGASIPTPIDVALDATSMRPPGQHIGLPTSGPVRITITGVGPREGGTDTGPSAVGFAELGIGTHDEVVRVPKFDTGTGPLAVVLTRLRTDPLDRWRSDPETRLVRSFDTTGARTFDATITLHLNSRADDRTLNGLTGASGPVANRRLTGDPNARGLYAADGDPSTAWTSPFGDVVGSELQFPLDGPVRTITLQQPTDQLHSIITGVRVAGASGSHDVVVPSPDGDGRSTLTLDQPVDGSTLTLTVTSSLARTTIDRRFAETTTLPVALREVSGNGLLPTDLASGDVAPTCATGLLTVDGHDVPVTYDANTMTELAAGRSADVHLCPGTTLSLAPGAHRLETASANDAAFQVDRVTLTSGVAAHDATASPSSLPSGPTVAITRTRTSRTATVSACPSGCWLIMGEGFNVGWTAATGGHDLGAPVQIAGGFNGWWLPPSTSDRVVDIQWTAQRPVTLGLIISAAGVLLCLVLVLRRRPARRRESALADEPPRWAGIVPTRSSWTSSATSAAVLVATSALIGSPRLGLFALAPAAVIVLTRRPRLAAWGAAVLMAGIGARLAQLEHSHHYLANAAWPAVFERLHQPSLLVVALVLASALTSTDDVAETAVRPTRTRARWPRG
jgi:arabinofuranan 3-O-arabinosyltransferase